MTNDPTPTVEGLNELRSRAVSWRRNHGGTPEHKQCDPIMRDLLSALAALREQNQELRAGREYGGLFALGEELHALRQAARQDMSGCSDCNAVPSLCEEHAAVRALLDQGQDDA